MAMILETDNFIVKSAEKPHVYVSREEGGHIQVKSKVLLRDRTKLTAAQAIEYMKLTMITGEAMVSAMARRGIDIGIINYQEMGNWSVFKPEGPTVHTHLFGRATTATIQKYGEAVQLPNLDSGFYENFKPLDEEDLAEIKKDIELLLQTEKYKSFGQV
jgi:diadenosine tetraphosphate (Ap4A) HIT family hydrolase